MSFNEYARKVRDPRRLPSIRRGALGSCIRHLTSLTRRSYRATCSRIAARFNLDSLNQLNEQQWLDAVAAIEVERNRFLERLRAFERKRVREKLRGRRFPRPADITSLYRCETQGIQPDTGEQSNLRDGGKAAATGGERSRPCAEPYYGPPGFTDIPEIRELLAVYEEPAIAERPLHTICFKGLPLTTAGKLATLLPRRLRRHRVGNRGPRFTQLLHLGREFPDMLLQGWRAPAGRQDEGIFITGYYYPPGDEEDRLHQRLREMDREPDEYYEEELDGRIMMFGWWD